MAVVEPLGEQAVLDTVDAGRRLAQDCREHVRLIAQQMHEQRDRRGERLTLLHRMAQAVDRAQRLAAGAHEQPALEAEP